MAALTKEALFGALPQTTTIELKAGALAGHAANTRTSGWITTL